MDGYLPVATSPGALSAPLLKQQTIANAICCNGIGLHTGRKVHVGLLPAPADTGIVFRRTDLTDDQSPDRPIDIQARFDTVTDTRLCTVLAAATPPHAVIGTVEHLMAALAASRIDNLIVEVDGPELPVHDGSAEPWMFLLDCAGTTTLEAQAVEIEILRPVRVQEGDAFAELRPGSAACLELSLAIEFDAAAIGRQSLTLALRGDAFRDVARARTFTLAQDIERLRAAGLARGGSLDNAVVVDGAKILNPSGLRMSDEFVRHKLLDAVGDLALAGTLRGRFIGFRSGHALNNRVLHALFADPANWRTIRAGALAWLADAA